MRAITAALKVVAKVTASVARQPPSLNTLLTPLQLKLSAPTLLNASLKASAASPSTGPQARARARSRGAPKARVLAAGRRKAEFQVCFGASGSDWSGVRSGSLHVNTRPAN